MEKETYTCKHCGAEADITLEGFEGVAEVVRRKNALICKACGKEIAIESGAKGALACQHCGAEADITLEGLESVGDVIKREKGVTCKACGQVISWTDKEDLRAIKVAMEAEKTERARSKRKRPLHARNYPWAQLMTRVFSIDVLACPRCGARMRILCAVNPPDAIRKILACLGLSTRNPPISSAM